MLDAVQAEVRIVTWSIGHRSDYRWIEVPIFDGKGYPPHERGITIADGLYFLGLPWLHTWGSGRFSGIARDDEHLAERIAARPQSQAASNSNTLSLNELAFGS